jgi:HlyD family secretion protein
MWEKQSGDSCMFKNKKVRNWLLAVIVFVAMAGIAFQLLSPVNASASAVAAPGKVVALEVAQTIEASGSLEAQPFAALTWNTSGTVQDANVKPGDQVQAGDVLMTLKTLSVSSNIISAQADLVNAQKELDDLLNSSDTELAQAVITLKDAREAYDKADNYLHYLQTSQKVPQTEARAVLETKRNAWMYVYKTKTFKGPAPEDWIIEAENDLALKKGQLDDAQRAYDRLKDGPNAQDITAAQAKVDAAQATVNSLYIIAPFNGQVLSVESKRGDSVDTGDLSINIADMKQLYVESQVDEADVANVKVGQEADVTLDGLSGAALTGKVAAINPVGEVVSGLVKYTVRIDLNPIADQAFIPLGTTANVTIHISDALSSLAVPIATIQNDASGEFVMVQQSDGSIKRVDVVSGEIVNDLVVVSGDLQEGQSLLVNSGSSFEAPNPFSRGNE